MRIPHITNYEFSLRETTYHVVLRNALGDADDKIQLSLHGFHDGGGSERRRDVDDGGVGLGFRLGFSDGVEDGKAQVFGSTLLRSHATNLLAVRVSKRKSVDAMVELTRKERKNEWIEFEIEMEREKGDSEGTMLVPYSMACSVWKVPFLPVIPWQMTRVLLSTKTAGVADENWRRPWRRAAMEDSNLVTACLPIWVCVL